MRIEKCMTKLKVSYTEGHVIPVVDNFFFAVFIVGIYCGQRTGRTIICDGIQRYGPQKMMTRRLVENKKRASAFYYYNCDFLRYKNYYTSHCQTNNITHDQRLWKISCPKKLPTPSSLKKLRSVMYLSCFVTEAKSARESGWTTRGLITCFVEFDGTYTWYQTLLTVLKFLYVYSNLSAGANTSTFSTVLCDVSVWRDRHINNFIVIDLKVLT